MSRTLYEISADLQTLESLFEEIGGEVTEDEAGQALELWFDQLGSERDAKVKNYCEMIANWETDAESCDREARRLARRADALENNAKRLKDRLKRFFEDHQIKQIGLATFKPHIRANGGPLPLILPDTWKREPASAPERFHKIKIDLATDLIQEAVKEYSELCPRCGGVAGVASDGDAGPIQGECTQCDWKGDPDALVRFGERGNHLRLR